MIKAAWSGCSRLSSPSSPMPNIGVNFAVSSALLRRVVDDLIDYGGVRRASPGLRVAPLPENLLAETAGVQVVGLLPEGAAENAACVAAT